MMFAGHRRGLAFRMKDGDKVVVGGELWMFMKETAAISCMQREITLEGAGALYERYLALNRNSKIWECLRRSTSSPFLILSELSVW